MTYFSLQSLPLLKTNKRNKQSRDHRYPKQTYHPLKMIVLAVAIAVTVV
jgi:hypothetical protein